MKDGLKITRSEQFATLPTEEQRMALFENVVDIKELLSEQVVQCDGRFKKIEQRKWVNTVASAGGGLIGGFISMITYLKFWK